MIFAFVHHEVPVSFEGDDEISEEIAKPFTVEVDSQTRA